MTRDDFIACRDEILTKMVLEADEKNDPSNIFLALRRAVAEECRHFDSLGAFERAIIQHNEHLTDLRIKKGLFDTECLTQQVKTKFIEVIYTGIQLAVKGYEQTGKRPQLRKLDS